MIYVDAPDPRACFAQGWVYVVRVSVASRPLTKAQEAMQAALRGLLADHAVSQSKLARDLTEAASARDLRRGSGNKEVRYDPAMVNRWMDGKLPVSRQAAWLLDLLYPRPTGWETFQDLRDRLVLATDREQAPSSSVRPDNLLPLVEGSRCSAEALANSRPRIGLSLGPDERLSVIFLSVVDCEESRQIVERVTARYPEVRLVAAYDVLGHWDIAIKLIAPADFDLSQLDRTIRDELVINEMADPASAEGELKFQGHRTVVVEREQVRRPDAGSDPRYLILDSAHEYDILRVQRAFLFVELDGLPDIRRDIARRRIEQFIAGDDIPEASRRIIEAVILGSDCVILELCLTCANGARRLNQLNRVISRELTRFRAQKYNLLVFTADEHGWPDRRRPVSE